MTGLTFEEIAKIIGHSSSAITSGVYGRLKQADVQSGARKLPWAEETETDDKKEEWLSVCKYLRCPWTFANEEWTGLQQPGAQRTMGSAEKRKLDAIAESRDAKKRWEDGDRY